MQEQDNTPFAPPPPPQPVQQPDYQPVVQNPYSTPINVGMLPQEPNGNQQPLQQPQPVQPQWAGQPQPPPFPPYNPYYPPMPPMLYPYQEMDPIKIYRKSIKKDAGRSCALLCILNIGATALAFLIMMIMAMMLVFSATANGGMETFLNNPEDITAQLLSGTGLFLTSMLPIIIIDVILIIIARFWFKIKFTSDMFCKPQSKFRLTAIAAFACLGAGVVGGYIYELITFLLGKLNIEMIVPDFSLPESMGGMNAMLFYVCILGPILEEIIFRGFILKTLQKHGELFAILLSSILFSLFHMNLGQFAHPFLIGLILGYITIKSRSIIPAIICHIFNNSIAMLTDYFFKENTLLGELGSYVYIVISLIALVLFIILYFKDIKCIPKGDATFMKTGKKLFTGLTAAWSIVFVSLFILNIGLLLVTGWLTNNM